MKIITYNPACISRNRILMKRKSGRSSGSSFQHSSIWEKEIHQIINIDKNNEN